MCACVRLCVRVRDVPVCTLYVSVCVWCMVYGVWCVVCGVYCMIMYDIYTELGAEVAFLCGPWHPPGRGSVVCDV